MATSQRVDVATLGPVPVVLAAATAALPGPGSFIRYSAEPKYDGFRAVLLRSRNGCVVQSRRGVDLSRSFPDLVQAAVQQLPEDTVLDGEAVVGVDGRLDFSELQRRLAAPARARVRAAAAPATFLAFDVLVLHGRDLRSKSLAERRQELAALMGACRPPLQQVPFTLDREEAQRWLQDYAVARLGVEGLVFKRVDEPYVGGVRRWLKLRHRESAEVLVGAVTGSLERPERLILALPDGAGGLQVAGGTTRLTDGQSREMVQLLVPAALHPWPAVLPSGRTGVWGGTPLEVTLVEPTLVVEVLADTAVERGHWRHVTRYLRPRLDLTAQDLTAPEPEDGANEPVAGQLDRLDEAN